MTNDAPSFAYYQSLGYPNQPEAAQVATNFIGMGLPDYLWYQMVNLLYKVDADVSDNLFCDNNNGGKCKLIKPCSEFPNLWTSGWTFKIQFTGSSNYLVVPISALAIDDTAHGYCDIYVQYLDSDETQSNNVIFGSLVNQLFA
jgi:hypothetical protein